MLRVGARQDLAAPREYGGSFAVMHGRRREQRETRVVMLVVVPVEEPDAEGARVLDAAEPVRELGPVLQRLELRLRVRVVVAHVRPRMSLGDSQIGEHQRHRFGGHRGAPVGVHRELSAPDRLLFRARLDQLLGERCRLPVRHHPAHHVTAEDVQEHVQVEVGPLRRAQELGDIPGPDLIRARREQLGLGIRGMAQLVAPLAQFPRSREQPVHGALRTQVAPLVEQPRVDRGRGLVDEALAAQLGEHRLLLLEGQCARVASLGARLDPRMAQPASMPVQRCAHHAQRPARGQHPARPGEFLGRLHQALPSSSSRLASGISSSCEAFFWISKSSSACSSLRCRRRLSRSSSATRLANGLAAFTLRPRLLGESPANSPRSRARRQVFRCEEYSPSRLSNAPISPASRAASASRRTRRLYSPENCRRVAFAGTSGSALRPRSVSPRAGKPPVALRAPCASPAPTTPDTSILSICSMVVSTALYTNFREGRCLTYIGREGWTASALSVRDGEAAVDVLLGRVGACFLRAVCNDDFVDDRLLGIYRNWKGRKPLRIEKNRSSASYVPLRSVRGPYLSVDYIALPPIP